LKKDTDKKNQVVTIGIGRPLGRSPREGKNGGITGKGATQIGIQHKKLGGNCDGGLRKKRRKVEGKADKK